MDNLKIPIGADLFTFERKLKSIQDLQHVAIIDTKIVTDPEHGPFILIMTPSKKFIQPLTVGDANYLSFYYAELHFNSLLPTIYQLYMEYMKNCGNYIDSITVESVKGDIVYCRVVWRTKRNKLFSNQCSLGDALIFGKLSTVTLGVVKSALDEFEAYDSSSSNYDFYDDENDDWYDDDDNDLEEH